MAFHEVTRMEQRLDLVRRAVEPGANLSALARVFGVDRKTVYKWRDRALAEGMAGVGEHSRAPHASPGRTAAETEAAVLALRAAHPAWGGRKLKAALERSGMAAPAASTITAILRRNGVAVGVLGGGAQPFQRFEHPAPNDLWQMDFKGHVAMATGARLNPLTVLDDHSRFCITLGACADQRTATVRHHLTQAFQTYGLPRAILTDNGSPWGDGPGSPFTPLGVWLIEQGIRHVHARPYHPQTLGKDERFHRTLKLEVLRGETFADLSDAARALQRWRGVYNQLRPHEAIGLCPPAERYVPSPEPFRQIIPPYDYPDGAILRSVQQGGWLSVLGKPCRIPKAFRGKTVALIPTGETSLYDVAFRETHITTLDIKTGKRHPRKVPTMSPNTCP